MKLIMTRGLPCAGKTTWSKDFVSKQPTGTWKIICKDDLREMLDAGKWSHGNEKFLLDIRNIIVDKALEDGLNVIVADTNFNPTHENSLRACAANYDAEFEIKDFDTTLEECIKRDAKRQNGVGEAVIRKMWYDYILPELEWPKDRGMKTRCIIADLDGTLAKIGKRSPYDASKCEEDGFHRDVWNLIESNGLPVVFCSGREEKYREQTLRWIEKNCLIPNATLYMRKTGDMRKDYQVKYEILRDHISPNWDPKAVYDDRNRVVDMWRKQGLRVYQVADGNF